MAGQADIVSSRAAASTLAENYTGYLSLSCLSQAQVVPGPQGPGEQRGQRPGHPGVGE
jgi:hypothetical protein